MNTGFLSPTTIIQNAQGVNSWSNPNNILIPNGQFAVSTGSTNILTLGNFNFNVGQDNLVSNFTVRVKGYRGSFNTTLQIIAIDDTSGVELAYPMTPFQGFSGSNTLYTLASSTFNTSWTVDQANNLKLRLIADGELYLDNIQIECSFVAINPVVPPTPTLGDLVVDEFVQGQRFQLAQSMTAADLFCFVQSFNFPNGTPIQITDFYGNALIVVDQGKAGLEENIRITNIEHNYNGSGLVRLSFTEIENRGLDFAYPYTHDITLCRAHTGTAEVVISNSAPFYDRFLKKNQADVLFSIPIEVKANGSIVTSHVHGFNFVGAGVVITPDGVDPDKVVVTIAGAQNATPVPVSTSTATSGTTAVPSLTWQHTTSGIDRLLRVLVSTDAVTAVSSVTYNGVALTLNQSDTNGVITLSEYFLVAPPVGTYDIVVTVSPNSVITAGAESYVSVNQASAIGVIDTDTGNSNNPTVTINTATDYSVIVDGIATAQTPIAYVTGSAQQIANYTVTPNTSSRQLGSSYQKAGTSPDAVVMDWTITQITDWVHLATEIKGTVATISSGVATVTGNYIDNTDPANPVSVVPLNNTAATAPTVNDDESLGYYVDSKWFDTVTGTLYTCTDATNGAAVWTAISGSGSPIEVEENGVSVETGVTKINILSNSPIVTNPATGEIDINMTGFGSGGGGSSKLAQDMNNFQAINSTGAYSTAFTVNIPGGTLGADNSIRVSLIDTYFSAVSSGSPGIRISYGGSVVATFDFDSPIAGQKISVSGLISSFLDSANQKSTFSAVHISNKALADAQTIAVDSTVNQNLVVEIKGITGVNTIQNIGGILVESIKTSGSGGGANTITATAGMDIDGSTTPKPVTFGNSDTGSPTSYSFFDQIGGGTFLENVGTTTREKVCYTVQVTANNIVQVDYLGVQIQGVIGSPVDQLRLSLQETTAGVPNGTILDSGTIPVAGMGNYFVNFANPVFLTPGVYAVVLDRTGAADNTNYWQHYSENRGGINTAVSIYDGTNWINDNKLVSIIIGAEYPRDNVYISAQGSGFRLQSVIVSSGSGNTYKETIPAVLQDSHGFVTSNVSTGNTATVAVSGAVSGFTGLTPTSLYEVTSSDGTIGVGTGTDVGRALTTTDIVIIPS